MPDKAAALVFDYFGVIASNKLMHCADLSVDSPAREMVREASSGLRGWQNFVAELSEELKISPKQLLEQYYETQIDPLVVGLIRELKAEYKIGLLTNASSGFIEPFLIKHHLDGLFDVKVISSDIGILKPDPEIFQYLIRKIGYQPEEIVFIDDSEANVSVAESLGMRAIRFLSYEPLVTKLKALGVIHA